MAGSSNSRNTVTQRSLQLPDNDPHHGAAGVDVDFKTDWLPPLPCMRWFVAVADFASVARRFCVTYSHRGCIVPYHVSQSRNRVHNLAEGFTVVFMVLNVSIPINRIRK
jgi:hypothetical protein